MVFSWTYGFHDGAVIGDAPDRKPTEKKIKQDGLHIDEDWVFRETLEPDGKATACKAVSSGFDSHRRLSVNAATALMFQSCSLWTLAVFISYELSTGCSNVGSQRMASGDF